jgi:salicylate hydroxylase
MTVWFGEGGHILTYYVRGGHLVNVVAFRESRNWVEESWSVQSQTSELLYNYPGIHQDLSVALERADSCFKWGLFDREPLSTWTNQRITLLGDAAHPMLPFLGQGAATAIEDGYVLARELANSPNNIGAALRAYEAERIPRTSKIQMAARDQPRFVHHTSSGAELNSDWLYNYDATLR